MDVQHIVQRGIGQVSVRLYHTQEWATLQNKHEQLSWFNLSSQLSPTLASRSSPPSGMGERAGKWKKTHGLR